MQNVVRGLIVALALCLAAPVSAAFGPGVSLVVFESVLPRLDTDAVTINLIGFHTGGGAISQLHVYLDCDPRTVPAGVCQPLPILQASERPEVVLGLSIYGINVPNWCGWTTGIVGYGALTAGVHTLYAAWTDTEHGRQTWYYAVTSFTK